MKVTESKNSGLVREYKIVIPAKDIETQVDAKLEEITKTVKLPGFRPGKAPKAMIKSKYQASVMGEVLDEVVRNSANKVIDDKKLQPAMQPKINLEKFDEGKDLEIKMDMEVLPEIGKVDFSDIKLEKLVAEVPESEVTKALEYISSQRKDSKPVTTKRKSKNGDITVIDFEGFVDGEAFPGGKGADYPLELGSNSFIPGFEEQLVGKNVGDELDVQVPFPEEYHAKDLAGKDAVFKVTVKELKESVPVEINDEFAKSMGEESLESLKTAIKTKISSDHEQASKMKLKRSLLDSLDGKASFDVPACLIAAEYKQIMEQYEQAEKMDQLSEEEKGKSKKDLEKEYKELSVRRVKLGILLSEVGKAEKLEIKQEDINGAIMKEAQKYPGQEKAVFDFYLKNKEAIEQLKGPIFEEKVVDFILGQTQVSDKKVSVEDLYKEDLAPAKKKTAAKKSTTKKTTAKKADGEKKAPAKKKATTKKAAAKK